MQDKYLIVPVLTGPFCQLVFISYNELVEHCKKIISFGGSPFVLSTGCPVAGDTPKENIDAMVAPSFADKLQI